MLLRVRLYDSFTTGLVGDKLASGAVISNTSVIVVCLCGGGAGGTAIFNGAAGADGAGGMFRVYYGSDYS